MADLIKIGHTFLNLDLVTSVQDLFPSSKQDKVVVRFGPGNELEFSGAGGGRPADLAEQPGGQPPPGHRPGHERLSRRRPGTRPGIRTTSGGPAGPSDRDHHRGGSAGRPRPGPATGGADVFTLTLYGPSGIELARVSSQPGEGLAEALLRAWGEVVDDGRPRMLRPGGEFERGDDEVGTGRGLAHVVLRDDPEGLVHAVEQVRFAADPPQF